MIAISHIVFINLVKVYCGNKCTIVAMLAAPINVTMMTANINWCRKVCSPFSANVCIQPGNTFKERDTNITISMSKTFAILCSDIKFSVCLVVIVIAARFTWFLSIVITMIIITLNIIMSNDVITSCPFRLLGFMANSEADSI